MPCCHHRPVFPSLALKLNRQHSVVLVRQAIAWSDRPAWLRSKKRRDSEEELMYRWEQCRREELLAMLDGRPPVELPTDGMMTDIMRVLDELFFGDQLSERVSVVWDEESLLLEDSARGRTERVDDSSYSIRLSTDGWKNDPERPFTRTRTAGVIATLLYEMGHAYINLYACHGHCGHDSCLAQSAMNNSHGRAWKLLATAVERKATAILDLGQLELTVRSCVAQEYPETGREPSRRDVRSMFNGRSPITAEVQAERLGRLGAEE